MESAPARALAGAGIVCLASVLQVLFVELLSRRSYDAFLIWTGVHTAWLVRTVCLAALWNGLWIALRGRGSAGLRWGGGLLLIPALIDYYKVEFRSAHFELSDLAETGEGLRILTKVHPRPAPVAVAALAVCLLALPCFLTRKKLCQGKKGARALWAALSFWDSLTLLSNSANFSWMGFRSSEMDSALWLLKAALFSAERALKTSFMFSSSFSCLSLLALSAFSLSS